MDTFAKPTGARSWRTKRSIARLFLCTLAAMGIGAVLVSSSALAWAAHLDSLLPVGSQPLVDSYSRTMLYLVIAGVVFAVAGLVLAVAAWVGASVNSRLGAGNRWHRALLWCGLAVVVTGAAFAVGVFLGSMVALITGILFGFGLLWGLYTMVAYLVGAPDPAGTSGTVGSAPAQTLVWPKARIGRWFGWGWLVGGAGIALALSVSSLTDPGRPLNGRTWTALVLIALFLAVAVYGALAEIAVAWAALFNAYGLVDRKWFKVLLWSDIAATILMPAFGIGALIMLGVGIAYLRRAPDSSAPGHVAADVRSASRPRWHRSHHEPRPSS